MLSQILNTNTYTHRKKLLSPSEEFGNVLFLVAFVWRAKKVSYSPFFYGSCAATEC